MDGLSEYGILQKLNHLFMVVNSYLTNYSEYTQSDIVELLAFGFTRMIKS